MLSRSLITAVVLCGWNLGAQTHVPAHSRNAEIRLEFADTNLGDVLDILVSDSKVKITLILPSGEEVTAESSDQERVGWEQIDPADLAVLARRIPILLRGAGTHVLIRFLSDHPAGVYKVRVDAQQVDTDSTITLKRIKAVEMLTALLQGMPGVNMTKSIPVPPGLKASATHLTLPKGYRDDYLDIVLTDPSVKIRIVLPDGRIIDASTAKRLGVEWEVGTLEAITGNAIIPVPLLPIKGTHTLVAFGSFQRPAGSYRIEADSGTAKNRSELTALFVPFGRLSEEAENAEKPKPGTVRAFLYSPEQPSFARTPVDLKLMLEGEAVNGPVTLKGQLTSKKDLASTSVTLTFTPGADHLHHAALTPGEAGIFDLKGTVSGVTAKGKKFSEEVSAESIMVQPLAARFLGFTERTVDEDHNGKPDRLEITAKLDVVEPGKYAFSADVGIDLKRSLRKRVERELAAGPQELTIQMTGLELHDVVSGNGPYRLQMVSINHETGKELHAVDIPRELVNNFRTTAYEREAWDRGNFYGTETISARPVDLEGSGKFQALRVQWDVVTPGGDCSWIAYVTASTGKTNIGGYSVNRGPLRAGPTTLIFDFDGNMIQKAGGDYDWHFGWAGVTCDNREMPNPVDHAWLDAGLLHPGDFEKLPPDFSLRLMDKTSEVKPGGPLVGALVQVNPRGELSGVVSARVEDAPAGLDVQASSPARWPGFVGSAEQVVFVQMHARAGMRQGNYKLTIVVEGDGRSHNIGMEIAVGEPYSAPTAPVASTAADPARPKNVLLVLGHTNSLNEMCQSMKDLAWAFPEQLQSGRDTLGALTFAVSINVAMPLTGDLRKAAEALNTQLVPMQCVGVNNLTYALEKAYDLLGERHVAGADNAVVVVTGQGSSMITADWPVRTEADHRAWIPRPLKYAPKVQLAVSGCPDSQGRTSNDPEWATGGSMPAVRGALWITRDQAGGIPRGPLYWADAPPEAPFQKVLSREKAEPTCSFASGDADIEMDVAYIPEKDAGGVALTGSRPLERFTGGPYQGKIRPDLAQNWRNALLNSFDNAVRRLREDPAMKAPVFLVSMVSGSVPEELRRLDGIELISVFAPEQVPGALDRIWDHLGRGKKH